ncbi:hypothetical protein VTJ49DRAFT_478 [Mycothermus thermophilus]|uniref:Zn(2)-C6 fungal-type domain-containing protein n=1 Tax=Humicola insolens TaxID=85995 RepID=A0ABR3VF49_HUMIN
MIKTDPSEDTLPQLRRPHPTSAAQDSMTPVTPHPAIPPPQPAPPPSVPPHSQPYGEDRRHMSFDNGPPPPMYSRQPSYQPQTPLPHPSPYDYPPQYASHGDLPYQIQVAAASGKRKAQRASQACDSCRQLKAKCDESKPCKSCKEKKVECKYREAVPKQQDKIAAEILDALVSLQKTFDQRMARLERAMARQGIQLDPPGPSAEPAFSEDAGRPASAGSGAPAAEDTEMLSPGGEAAVAQAPPPPVETAEPRAPASDLEEDAEVEPGPLVKPGVPSIPHNHTTLAAFLLKWRPISVLVRGILEAENVRYVDEFPISQEEKRGVLRIWGRGEGKESSSLRADKSERDNLRDLGPMEVALDDVSDVGVSSPADCWGTASGSLGPIDGKSSIITQGLDLTESTVLKYVKSYQDNIQNMHPLIAPADLHGMVKSFLDSVQLNSNRQSRGSGGGMNIAKFVGTPTPQFETGMKRKRSPPPPDGTESPSSSPRPPRPIFPRSINSALVLLVLALGKICLHKDRIPDVVPASDAPQSSPLVRNGYPPSPGQASSPSNTQSSAGLPSPKEAPERPGPSRRSSMQGQAPTLKGGVSLKRNLDVIPGLDYFACATDIMGGQLAGTTFRHICSYLLAGLYHGQLGRVLESYAYIKEAGYAIQVRMRPSLDRFRKLQELMPFNTSAVTRKSDNQLTFAFWTCLQLESDIIAELPLPQSQILAYEDMMPYPNIKMAEEAGFDQHVLQSYLAQLYLRKSLNQIHGMLYNPEKPLPATVAAGSNIIDYIQSLLDMRFVPPEFKFDINDPPAGDILSARLRAKYWGAQVITYRPFVRQILEHNFQRTMALEGQMPASVDFRSGVVVPVIGPDEKIPAEMIEYARKGVRALIESTRAFHGLKEKRFIVTNVFGTAHAQWGNLLTLSAVFRDPTLKEYVDEDLLKHLFNRTISFFRVIAHPSSALYIDLRILEGLERELWGKQGSAEMTDHPTGSSFSSTMSAAPPVHGVGPAPATSATTAAPTPTLASATIPVSTAALPPVAKPHGLPSPVPINPVISTNGMSVSPPLASPVPASLPLASPTVLAPMLSQSPSSNHSPLPPPPPPRPPGLPPVTAPLSVAATMSMSAPGTPVSTEPFRAAGAAGLLPPVVHGQQSPR